MQQIKRDWINYIDLSLIDIYPIQFANCDRLQRNDAVYIFDEVGSGKTISSGLMALDYLFNNSGKVLVITTNALAKKGLNAKYGQFVTDWFDKLPFNQLGLVNRIDVVNNHYSNLRASEDYGLVIIDEAQLFLNEESLRYRYLSERIRAEKIVFLTATPIKTSKSDLYTYVRLASAVTNKELSSSWIDEINTSNKEPKEIICSTFNVDSPVTRYFKDTIMSLNVEGYQKRQARRLTPQLWQYGVDETKNEVLLRMINMKHEENINNKFVIFTRFVDKEAKVIEDMLINAGFKPYDGNDYKNEVKTFKIITGSNAYELSGYSGTSNLPTVLVLTYQIAEQGVNLPGYNHVVNYHVSAFPSALEQRFGRIDRMGKNGSQFTDINMCFLISKDYWDTNTGNFYCAITTYLHSLISYLPSKNTILSEEIIKNYGETKDYVKAYIEKIKDLINQTEQIDSIIKYFTRLNDEEIEDKTTIACDCDSDLFEFIEENGIEFDLKQSKENAKKEFFTEVKEALTEFGKVFSKKEEFTYERYTALIKNVSDKIFYSQDAFTTNIRTVDAISECGKFISEQASFREYSAAFKNHVKLPILVLNYMDEINHVFEMKFLENDFNFLFPYKGYTTIFHELLKKKEISEEDKQLIIDHCNIIVTILPVYKMFHMYESSLQDLIFTQLGDIRKRFDFNPFLKAFCQVYAMIRRDTRHLGLSDDFFCHYFAFSNEYNGNSYSSIYYNCQKFFVIEHDDDTKIAQASNWYKLAYHYTRKEEACFIGRSTLCMDESDNFYKFKESLIRFLATKYNDYCKIHDAQSKECHACDLADDDVCVYEMMEEQLESVIQRRDNERYDHQSLFHRFIFTKRGSYREHSKKIYIHDDLRVHQNDIWTQGIFHEIKGYTYEDYTYDKIVRLPKRFEKVSIY